MQNSNTRTVRNTLLVGVLAAIAFTAAIAITAPDLSRFAIVGKTIPFAYPWRLVTPSFVARLTAWGGYLLHNMAVWGVIFLASRSLRQQGASAAQIETGERRPGPRYSTGLRWFNWTLIGINTVFIVFHWIQSHLWFDGLAQDVPELSALGSVALMLIVILILETPRRGLIFGRKMKFHQKFLRIVREYHGYLFSWATIYTFWFHPTAGTIGHLAGFFYMFMLFFQGSLIFNRAHLNKWWTFTLEFFVLIHGVLVAIFQGNALWPMFAFGFGAMLVLTQMYGLGLGSAARRLIAAGFVALAVIVYAVMGRLPQIHEIIRIPALDYGVVFLLYALFLAGKGIADLLRRSSDNQAARRASAE